ncbi:MAG: hypothetical protein SAK29_15055 [Scytonema sp. PMC 1069.18]|nr:hypothetical protein [Scytonema sp. PMC 1069.18]MEC4887193.1 hypothetical protein [Scytonema sp. PMC 1070.18]
MLKVGDYAQHQITGQVGTVIGYGHEVLRGVYLTTLKVRAFDNNESPNKSKFVEDVYSAWVLTQVRETSGILKPQLVKS